MKEPLLLVKALSVGAGGRRLLDGVEVGLERREIVALVGPSGCGKTTLLRAVAGLTDPLAGEVTLGGRAAAEIGWPHFRRRVIYVAQRPELLAGTVQDNLALPFTFAAAEGSRLDVPRARDLLDAMGIGDLLEQQARTLSEGEKQRVALARALLVTPDVLLLDEPTSALDADSCTKVEEALRSSAVAALLVSHDAEQVARLDARVIDLAGHLASAAAEVAVD